MKKYKLHDFTKGWFIGNFEPSLLITNNFEIAIKEYTKGDEEESHYHKIATEYTVINSGKFLLNNEVCSKGDIIVVKPGESVKFICLEDGSNTVIKTPCIIGDKYQDNI